MNDALTPINNPHLFGHDGAIERIAKAWQANRMHHAWLVTGRAGIGKMTLACHMAHFVLSGGQNRMGQIDLKHPAARLVAAEAHPDMMILRRALDDKTGELKNSIAVEDARQIAPFLQKTASHGGWRVAIIDEAQLLNRFGQNAILKIIEEPPQRCLLVITTTTAGNLLPTIRSRCSVLHLEPLAETDLRRVLTSQSVDLEAHAEIQRLLHLAEGSAGFLWQLLQSEALEFHDAVQGLNRDFNMIRLHQLAEQIGKKGDKELYAVTITLMLAEMARDIVRRGRGSEPALATRLQLWDKIRTLFNETDHANLDRKLAFIQAVTEIHQAA